MEPVVGSVLEQQRQPDVGPRGQHLAGRDDSGDRCRQVVDAHAPADHIRVAIEVLQPERFAQVGDALARPRRLGESPAHHRLDTQRIEEGRCGLGAAELTRIALASEADGRSAATRRPTPKASVSATNAAVLVADRLKRVSPEPGMVPKSDRMRPASGKGSGFSSTVSTTLNTAVADPMVRARQTNTGSENAVSCTRVRELRRSSVSQFNMGVLARGLLRSRPEGRT